ncbi:MAG TPA: tRNA-dihydrouridine synthase, partial [Hyphomicrobiaceae bacterium]|nr:tRNA-dihydrouridine synthase [Hyphomicrobiaceae bacterium]
VPVTINGDIIDPASARAALEASGADAVMVGRGAYGAPWMPARIDAALATGCDPGPLPLRTQGAIARRHVEDMLTQYGARHGLTIARKHIGWYLASSGRPADVVKAWRKRLCTVDDSGEALSGLASFYQEAAEMAA